MIKWVLFFALIHSIPGQAASSDLTNVAVFVVHVPASAKVFVMGRPTKSTGVKRRLVAHTLQPNQAYTYQIYMEADLDGRHWVDCKVVKIYGGQEIELDFRIPEEPKL